MALLGVLSAAIVLTAASAAVAATRAGGTGTDDSWTVYHGNPEGTGVATGITSVESSAPTWTSPSLDGQIYGEPLVSNGRVYVATENDTVYAVSASTGAVEWSAHLGTPVPSSSLPCGDISPTAGITGTPVVDPGRSEVFVVASELEQQRPAHELVGLDAETGKIELTQDVDPPGSTPSALLQRTGLALDADHVVFGFGGNFGDCSTYHGWVISVPETGGSAEDFAVDSGSGQSQGAIWMGGAAPVVDANGDIWVEAGNGSVRTPGATYDDSDSVLELSPALKLLQYFAPSSWATENATDLDLSTAPALLANGLVVAAGKDRTAYLLNGARLGGVGGAVASLSGACTQVIDGGAAVVGTTVYLPCLSGPVAVEATAQPAALRVLWRARVGGGPPIVAAGLVWTMGQNGTLYGLSTSTGAVVEQAHIGVPANHFPTPSVGDGLLLAAGSDRVVAFAAPPSASGSGSTTSSAPGGATTTHATTAAAPPGSGGGPSPWAVVAIVLGAAVLVLIGVWLWRRRRAP